MYTSTTYNQSYTNIKIYRIQTNTPTLPPLSGYGVHPPPPTHPHPSDRFTSYLKLKDTDPDIKHIPVHIYVCISYTCIYVWHNNNR